MSEVSRAGTWLLGEKSVSRMGYGTMQLAGPQVFGPPRDRNAAISVLRAALESGITHFDTSDFYGPHITNQIVREALSPYRDDVTLVTKIGVKRGEKGQWNRALTPEAINEAVHDNLRNLGLEVLDVVNLRLMFNPAKPVEGDITEPLEALIALKEQGLIRELGISNATLQQVTQARSMTEIVCVQNMYNLANRQDDAMIDLLAAENIAYVPFFPLGGFTPLQSAELDRVAAEHDATPKQVALAWLLQRSPNILLIPGTSSLAHLRENIASVNVELSDDAVAELDAIAG
ncbi:oxidoreductase [Duffyella gerundensis]|jgi:aryl-alcohol dehydrogenase-like predicted oxidoreductase|uniref:aldo/keto reductase family oxidoreductase n=1 Tax=Duffyella gerundensis TaxID=1619313 RepID=UPI0016541FA8|nr:aldo/keto reductase family oxidoreductase [Duffyella gerundensis]UCB31045.1 oxidoreductase [Duffyella gerundensis]